MYVSIQRPLEKKITLSSRKKNEHTNEPDASCVSYHMTRLLFYVSFFVALVSQLNRPIRSLMAASSSVFLLYCVCVLRLRSPSSSQTPGRVARERYVTTDNIHRKTRPIILVCPLPAFNPRPPCPGTPPRKTHPVFCFAPNKCVEQQGVGIGRIPLRYCRTGDFCHPGLSNWRRPPV